MSNVNGVVEATSNKFGKFSVMVGGNWYATKEEWAPTPRPNKGDVVEFDDGGGKYLKKCRIVGAVAHSAWRGNGEGGKETPDRQRSIVRQNALTNAVSVWRDLSVDPEDTIPSDADVVSRIIQIARGFEFYTSGDLDEKEAEGFQDN